MLEWATNKFKYSVGNIIWINCLIEFFLVLTVGLMAYAISNI